MQIYVSSFIAFPYKPRNRLKIGADLTTVLPVLTTVLPVLTTVLPDLTTVLPVLFKYCYNYGYSDSRKL